MGMSKRSIMEGNHRNAYKTLRFLLFWAGRISPFFLHNVVRLAGRPGFSDYYYTTSDDVNDDNNKSEMIGLLPLSIERTVISLAPKNSTTAINTENMGKLFKVSEVSPAKIIANNEGIPRRFTSTLEDFFVVIITLK